MPGAFEFLRITSTNARLDGNPNDELKAEGRFINFDGQPYDPNNTVSGGDIYTAKGSLHRTQTLANRRGRTLQKRNQSQSHSNTSHQGTQPKSTVKSTQNRQATAAKGRPLGRR